MQDCTDGSDRSFDAVFPRRNALHKGEGRDQSDGSVATHSEITDIIKEDHTRGASAIDGLAQ